MSQHIYCVMKHAENKQIQKMYHRNTENRTGKFILGTTLLQLIYFNRLVKIVKVI